MKKATYFASDNTEALTKGPVIENTRKVIAISFVTGYLIIIGVLILLTTFSNLKSDTAKDYLLAIGSPLGFIIGFYFKAQDKE